MTSKLVTYAPPAAPQMDGVTSTFIIAELVKIANSIKTITSAWANPSFTGYVQTGVVTVANLPAAASCPRARYMVSDANATAFYGIVAGGGVNIVPVFSDGTNWRIG